MEKDKQRGPMTDMLRTGRHSEGTAEWSWERKEDNLEKVFQEGGAEPEEECGKLEEALSGFQTLKNKRQCKKTFGSNFSALPRSNLQNRRSK